MGLRSNKKKRRQKKSPTAVSSSAQREVAKGPRILVIKRGTVGLGVQQLLNDVQTMLAPSVIQSIKVLRSSRVKDLVKASGPLHITHTIIFTRTSEGAYMKLCTMPSGPTITFMICQYSLMKDVRASQKRPTSLPPIPRLTPPCLMMNNLQPDAGPKHMQLVAASMLQIFPKILPDQSSCENIKRCCLLYYDPATELLDFRHYAIHLASSTSSKLISVLINKNKIPDLHKFESIEDALDKDGLASDSEYEEDSKVDLKHLLQGRESKKPRAQQNAVKLKDAGPRFTLKVHKIETGLLSGDVLYHQTITVSPEEAEQRKQRRLKKLQLKAERKKQQDENIERKKAAAAEHKQRCLSGMPAEMQKKTKINKGNDESGDDEAAEGYESEDEDEEQYFKDAVGQDPDIRGCTLLNFTSSIARENFC
ncbi:suppressor of SWI4 1 homolog [Hyalella azteca]|uniref:Suppressor of SWI4 1 homolog n=1 Tax=Hyalella azteca TaxID=294128 RepID=A0A8B7PPK9_HYAAZ|nr:suppressor of SWI4 1 homolog [Hyalella azteca]